MLEADAEELHEILGRDPDRQPPLVERLVADVADAQAGHAHAVLVGIERAQRLAERLADAVAAVGPHRDVGADAGACADRSRRRGWTRRRHALHALAARRLEQIVAADDVGLQDRLPGPFDREAAEMDDAVDALDDLLDLVELGEIGGDEASSAARSAGGDVAQPQPGRSASSLRRRLPMPPAPGQQHTSWRPPLGWCDGSMKPALWRGAAAGEVESGRLQLAPCSAVVAVKSRLRCAAPPSTQLQRHEFRAWRLGRTSSCALRQPAVALEAARSGACAWPCAPPPEWPCADGLEDAAVLLLDAPSDSRAAPPAC